MDEPRDTTLREISQTRKDKYGVIPLIRGPWSGQIHAESRMVGIRVWGRGMENSCFMEIVSVWEDGKF